MSRSLCLTLLVVLVGATTAAAGAPRAFVIDGRGWGHGVGMSQWGAEGLAAHGWRYRQILAHYYPGTTLRQTANVPVRVLLREAAARLAVRSGAAFDVMGSRGAARLLAGRHPVVPLLRRLGGPLRFTPGAAPLALDGDAYRGDLLVSGAAGSLTAVNVVPLERYLRGVVPWEMPHDWRGDALRAQAVAARSYALATLERGETFDLYADTRDQVYGGIRAETPQTNAAVGATAGQVLTWRGRVALTYYFSSSGGRTASAAEGLPWAPRVPYLVSVDDPYDAASPNHTWGPLVFRPGELARRLGVPGVGSLVPVLAPSRRVVSVLVGWRGGRRTIGGREFQAKLGLRSTWFSVRGAAPRGAAATPDGIDEPTAAAPPPPPAPRSGDWPTDEVAWTVVLQSAPEAAGEQAARALARRAAAAGAPAVGILRSGDFASLRPGYWVVYSGRYGSGTAARSAAASLAGRFAAAYARRIA